MIFQIAAIVAASVAGLVWWWRRSIEKQANALTSVADGIVFLRQTAGVMPRMVPIAQSDERDAQFREISAELESAGFRMLGDVEEYKQDGTVEGVLRWFVSADGHVCGWFGMSIGGPVVLLLSEDAGRGFATTIRSAPAPGVTRPENIRRNDVGLDASVSDAIQTHHHELSKMTQPVIVRDLDEALACFRRMSVDLGAWRSRQEPGELLEADIRNVTHEYYEAVGDAVTALVQIKEGMRE